MLTDGYVDTSPEIFPEEWEIKSIKSISIKLKAGGTPRRGNPSYYGGEIPFVKIADITNSSTYLTHTSENISYAGLEASSAWIIPQNAVLLAMYGSIGKVTITGIPVATNQAIIAIVPKPHISNEFLFYSLLYFGKELPKYNIQSTQKNINKGIVERFELPIPPLPEQRAIAHVLSTVRQAIDATEQVIAAARELKRSMMKHLFTYGSVSVQNAENVEIKETEIGMMPESWTLDQLRNLAEIEYGIQAAVSNNTDPSIGIAILTNKNITLHGTIDLSALSYYDISENENDKLLKKGDILFNWRSGSQKHVGKSALFELDDEFTHSSFILRFRPDEKILSHFLKNELYKMWSEGYFMQKRSQSSVNSVFNKSASQAMPIGFPNIDEQKKISDYLTMINKKIASEIDNKCALESLFNSLLHHLMTGKLRVADNHDD